MTLEDLNTQLYKMMFAEQEEYRKWLLAQTPEEIIQHSYEHTLREDVLLSLEYHDLSKEQCEALLTLESPLADIFKDFEKRETDHMDDIWDTVVCRADTVLKQRGRRIE